MALKELVPVPSNVPLSERFDQIKAWLFMMGYEVRSQAGCADDSDWDVTFVPLKREWGEPCPVWTFHAETRQGLARTLSRHVTSCLEGQ